MGGNHGPGVLFNEGGHVLTSLILARAHEDLGCLACTESHRRGGVLVDMDELGRARVGVGAVDVSGRPVMLRSAALGRAFRGATALQQATNAGTDGDLLQARGHCGAATLTGRTGVTIQGPFPTGGRGFNGPSATALRAEVDGLTVSRSTSVSVQFLNLVNSSSDGLAFVNATTPLASCNCTARNRNDGVRMSGTIAGVISQTLSELNRANGIEANLSQTVIISNNTATQNTGNGHLRPELHGHQRELQRRDEQRR